MPMYRLFMFKLTWSMGPKSNLVTVNLELIGLDSKSIIIESQFMELFPIDQLFIRIIEWKIPQKIVMMTIYLQWLQADNSFNPFPNDNFRLFQSNRVSKWHCWIWWRWQKVLKMGKKHRGKRRNCSLWAISPFPTVLSKDLYCRHVKTRACLGKG